MSDKETMMALHAIEESRRKSGYVSEKPAGPRVSQVGETERRLGEIISMLHWLGAVVMNASPKFKTGKIPKVEPYTKPVVIDGATGEWTGKRTDEQKLQSHQRRVDLVKQAARTYEAQKNKG